MHQIFTKLAETKKTPQRFRALRRKLEEARLDGFIVPRADEFQNEYVPANAERLRWLTGFSGSAGLAVILAEQAAIFVDGRYVLQVQGEIDPSLLTPLQIPQNDPAHWLARNAADGARIGFDPRLHNIKQIERWTRLLQKDGRNIRLIPLDDNPVDQIWSDRPAPPLAPVKAQPLKYAGKTAAKKISALQKKLAADGLDAFVLANPTSICWLFNIRGDDVPHTPLVLCYAILPAKGQPELRPELFIDPRKLDASMEKKLRQDADLHPVRHFPRRLDELKKRPGRIGLDPMNASAWLQQSLKGGACEMASRNDPCTLPKALKNSAEIRGMRNAHIRDGAAVTRFLCWLQEAAEQASGVDEIGAAQKLEEFRRETGQLLDISFETISGAGPHGAIVHYRVDEDSNQKLRKRSLYLVDSGGQYKDGTTDITRTVAIGDPSEAMCRHYTLVLKGHVALADAFFPVGTRGVDLDPLARRALWRAGLDYDHGTGHGVGAYLGVHEGPQGISRRAMTPLQEGMIISNEPGYYRTNAYGIRIESLLLVKPARKPKGGERPMLSFETLTMAPFDRRLIMTELLERAEIDWINAYHQSVHRHIFPQLDCDKEKEWLQQAVLPLDAS